MSLLAADDQPVAIQMGFAPDGAFGAETMSKAPYDVTSEVSIRPANTFVEQAKSAVSSVQSSASTALRSVGQTVAGTTGANMAVPVALGLAAVGVFFAVRAAQGKKAISFGKKRSSTFKIGK